MSSNNHDYKTILNASGFRGEYYVNNSYRDKPHTLAAMFFLTDLILKSISAKTFSILTTGFRGEDV